MARKREERAVRSSQRAAKKAIQNGGQDPNFVSLKQQLVAMGLTLREIPGDGWVFCLVMGDLLSLSVCLCGGDGEVSVCLSVVMAKSVSACVCGDSWVSVSISLSIVMAVGLVVVMGFVGISMVSSFICLETVWQGFYTMLKHSLGSSLWEYLLWKLKAPENMGKAVCCCSCFYCYLDSHVPFFFFPLSSFLPCLFSK